MKGVITMSDIINYLKSMETSTLLILGFAVVLLILLLVLIIITIKVLKSSYEEDVPSDDLGESNPETPEEDEEDDDEEDETSKMVREAVASVAQTKARVEAEKMAKEVALEAAAAENEEDEAARASAAMRVEQIAQNITQNNSQNIDAAPVQNQDTYDSDEDESEDYDPDAEEYDDEENEELSDDYNPADDEKTGELDTDKIREALRKERADAQDEDYDHGEMAKQRAEAPEYNASFDSAFVDRPAYEERVDPVIPNPTPQSMLGGEPAAMPSGNTLDASEEKIVSDAVKNARNGDKITVNPVNVVAEATEEEKEEVKEFLEENPKPEQKKKKLKKHKPVDPDSESDKMRVAKYFWYNTQDIEGLARKEDMYFKCHYFNDADEVILDIITEMYDCGFVRTEELQRIAYGITFQSLGMKEILKSEESLAFDKDKATKEPSEIDRQVAYEKWCNYVNEFLKIIVINAPDEVEKYIIDQMYEYGHKDIADLMYSPY